MNRAYRLIWNTAKDVWLVASEKVKSKGGLPAGAVVSTIISTARPNQGNADNYPGRVLSFSSMMMALEPRFMFDAAGVATADLLVDSQHDAAPTPVADKSVSDTQTVTFDFAGALSKSLVNPVVDTPAIQAEVAFVDARVPDIQSLISGIKPGIKVFILDPGKDGVAQVTQALQDAGRVSAIHIVSHGAVGEIFLGATELNSRTLTSRATDIALWRDNLAQGADILIYGCDVTKGETGQQFADLFSNITGADLAGSSNNTGASAMGGDWTLETATGPIEASSLLTTQGVAAYQNRLSTISLSGQTGWTAIMFGTNKDPDADSQAGAADTDIIGDANHGSLYTAYDDNGTTTTTDDYLAFRMRIDNPTSDSYFGGVAIVGMDANLDGRVDLFMSVDGRNNTQAVRLLDPGTDANISPNTTSTAPLPTGWLPNNGIYPFSNTTIYNVSAVSSTSDPHYGSSALSGGSAVDLTGDGKTDAFVSWKIPVADLATVLAKPSPIDRSGVSGPRGITGIAGFTSSTTVQYVNFTQTQPGPINGDLNGVGASYDKNATFATLGAFTTPMSPDNPVSDGPGVTITEPISGGMLTDAEDNSVSISGVSVYLASKPLTLTITDGTATVTGTTTTASDGTWTVSGLNLSGLNNGTLTVTATVDSDSNAGTDNNIIDTATVLHDKTPPTITIDQLAAAVSGTPVISGTSDLPDGSLITLTIDPDNNSGTANNLVYQVMVSAGVWSLDTSVVTPTSGTMPLSGLNSYSKITATATDTAGNSASATAINRPTVTTLSTNDTTPVISGTWTNIAGDVLTVTVSDATYTLSPAGNTWSVDLGTATPSSGTLTTLVAGNNYPVTATVARSTSVSDTTTNELTITSTPVIAIDITGGATASGSDTTPTIEGTSSNSGGFVIVRLDPNNDGNLSDAVTYSVTTGDGAWTLDTGTATPISGQRPAGGFVGAVGIQATDSTGAVSDAQVLTITTPSVAITSITSTAVTDGFGQVDNSGAAANWLNMTEDNLVTISGTATGASTVDIVITDPNGNFVEYTNVAVSSGNWSVTNKDLSSLDNGVLTVVATISGSSTSATNTTVTHDKTAPIIDITAQDPIKKTAAVITGRTDLPAGTSITVEIYDVATLKAAWNNIVVDANGYWTTNGITVSSGAGNIGTASSFTIKAFSTSTTTDLAKNITQLVQETRNSSNNASANSITIGTVAVDNIITVNEIGSGLTLSGTTTLTTALPAAFTVTVSDGTTTVTIPADRITNTTGNWTAALTTAEIQSLKNGPLTVSANVNDAGSSVNVNDVAFPTLTLASPVLTITDNCASTASGDVTFTFTFTEAVTGFGSGDITVTNGSKGTFSGSGTTYTLVVTPTSSSSGNIVVSVASNLASTGIQGTNTGRTNTADSDTQPFDTTGAADAPTVTISTAALATDTTPLITGTCSLAAGAPIVINIDTDNDGDTDLTYSATVQSGNSWSLDIGSATPTFGTLPADGLSTSAKVTAVATNSFGNSASAIGLNTPMVTAQSTNDSTPTVTGAWTQLTGDTLAVVINSVTYSVANGNLDVTATGWSLTPSIALSDATYSVTATTTRASGGSATDGTTSELIIDTAASVDITSYGGGATGSTNDSTPVISGTTSGIPNGTVLTLSLDSDNNGSYELVYKTTVSSNAWSVDTATAIPFSGSFPASGLNGPVPMQATATDPATNTGSDAQTLTIDVTPPIIGITSNSKTPDTTPLITGTTDLPVGSTITLVIDPDNVAGGTTYTYTAIVQTGGTWSVDTGAPTTNGGSGPTNTYTSGNTLGLNASGTDSANNSASATKTLQITTAPTIDVTRPLLGGDYKANATEDNSVPIGGAFTGATLGDAIRVSITDGTHTINDTTSVLSETSGAGTWALSNIDLSTMDDGTITVSTTLTDSAGDAYLGTTTFQHDKTPPVATLSSSSTAITGATSVTVTFAEAVTDLELTDFVTSNGAILSNLSGSGTTYTLTITPAVNGSASIWMPAAGGRTEHWTQPGTPVRSQTRSLSPSPA